MGITGKIAAKVRTARIARLDLATLERKLAARRGVLTLCYHALDEALGAYPYRTRRDAFDAHLGFLDRIFDVVPAGEAVAALRDDAVVTRDRPMAVICFDDGYRCNLTEATPVLERHGMPAMLFAARDLIRQPGQTYMGEAELRQLASHALWDCGAHGITHNVLPGFLDVDQAYEITESKRWLADLLGQDPCGFAYPQGQISPSVVRHAQQAFGFAMSTDQRLGAAFDPHQIRRFCPTQDHDDLHLFACALVQTPFETGRD